MKMRYRIIIAFVLVCGLGFLIGMKLATTYENGAAPSTRTDTDFTTALSYQRPELFTKDNTPIFTISKTTKVADGWYLLQLSGVQTHTDSYIVIHDEKRGLQYMKVIIGPNSEITKSELLYSHIPNDVIKLLEKMI